jgi:acetyl-CoA C-acetyltransferase
MQDQFSLNSHQNAIKAQDKGRFRSEIIPVENIDNKGSKTKVLEDEHPRRNTSLEALSILQPVFSADGTITAGNASSISDGAAALILSSKSGADMLGVQPLAEIISISEVSGDPRYFGLMPEKAIKKILSISKLKLEDIELIELNEAFAAQAIAVITRLKINKNIVNVNGGAIALGHPIGASGARIVVTLLHEMIKRNAKYGLSSLCIGSGEGMAMILRRL